MTQEVKEVIFERVEELEKFISEQMPSLSIVILDKDNEYFGEFRNLHFYAPKSCEVNTKYDNIYNALNKRMSLVLNKGLLGGFDSRCLSLLDKYKYNVYFAATPYSQYDLRCYNKDDWNFLLSQGVVTYSETENLKWKSKVNNINFAYGSVKSLCDLDMLDVNQRKNVVIEPVPIELIRKADNFYVCCVGELGTYESGYDIEEALSKHPEFTFIKDVDGYEID